MDNGHRIPMFAAPYLYWGCSTYERPSRSFTCPDRCCRCVFYTVVYGCGGLISAFPYMTVGDRWFWRGLFPYNFLPSWVNNGLCYCIEPFASHITLVSYFVWTQYPKIAWKFAKICAQFSAATAIVVSRAFLMWSIDFKFSRHSGLGVFVSFSSQ